MGPPLDNDRAAPFEAVHPVAQSYLGTLWVAADKRGGEQGKLALLRRVRLPEGTPSDARQAIAQAAADAQRLEHENILSVLDVLDAGAEIGIAYEYVEAEPLRTLQSSAASSGLAFPIAVSLRIGIDLLMGLDSLHQAHASVTTSGVFGGLSPDSVLVSKKGEIKLCDALVAGRAALLEGIGSDVEKLGYAAPEQVLSLAPLAPPCDVFAAGAVLWELLTSRRLLAGTRSTIERRLLEHDLPSLSDSVRGGQAVSAKLAAIVEAALAADPRQRPESARAMAELLQQCEHPVASHEQVARFVAALSGKPLPAGLQTARQVAPQSDDVAPSTERRLPAVLARIVTRPMLVPASSLAHASTPRLRLPMPTGSHSRMEQPLSLAPRKASLRPTHPAQPAPSRAPGRASSAAQLAPPRPVSRRPAQAQPSLAPRSPAPPAGACLAAELESSAQVAAAVGRQSEPPPPVAPIADARSPRTMIGIGLPALPAPPAPPVESTPPSALSALPHAPRSSRQPPARRTAPATPSAARVESAFLAEEPPSSSTLHAFSLPPPPLEPLADQTLWRALAGTAGRASESPKSLPSMRRKLALGLLGATLGGAVALGSTLKPRPSNADTSPEAGAAMGLAPEVPAPLAPAEDLRGAGALARVGSGPLPDEASASSPRRDGAPVQVARPAAEARTENAAAQPAASALGHDFYAAKLGDSQLVEAFALERRRDLPTCSERLGAAAATYTGNQPEQSRFHFNAARRALQHGQFDTAHTELCAATAQDPGNLDALRSMAELALDLGDPARAKESAELGLARMPKNAELLGLLGDALAMSGDIAGSRRIWLGILGDELSEGERRQLLAVSYQKAGERALSVFNFARARSDFRRALILTEGGDEPSLGLSDALLWLDHGRAGFAWAERAARARPQNARAQILLGDAYAKNGELENARATWQAAQGIEPNNHIAARRLSRGPR